MLNVKEKFRPERIQPAHWLAILYSSTLCLLPCMTGACILDLTWLVYLDAEGAFFRVLRFSSLSSILLPPNVRVHLTVDKCSSLDSEVPFFIHSFFFRRTKVLIYRLLHPWKGTCSLYPMELDLSCSALRSRFVSWNPFVGAKNFWHLIANC